MKNKKRFVPWLIAAVIIAAFAVIGKKLYDLMFGGSLAVTTEDLKNGIIACSPAIIFIVVVLIAALIVVVAAGKLKQPKRALVRAQAPIAILLAITLSVNWVILGVEYSVVNSVFAEDVKVSDETMASGRAIADQIASEGIVLLKNDDKALPLSAGTKLNLFGWSSVRPLYGGTGSGDSDTSNAVSLIDGLKHAGFEVNEELVKFYENFRTERPVGTIRLREIGSKRGDFTVPEPTIAEYENANIFEDAVAYSDTAVVVVSRADGFANYAEATAAPANHSLSAQALADYASAATYDAAKYDDPNAVMPTTGANNRLKLADLTGVAYDDPKWEQLLDELTVNDLFSLTADGGYHTVGVESIGLSATEDCDGPTGVHSNYNPAAGPSYPGTVMLACTWNQPLAKARGEQIAKECAEINCAGWYAPAMNIHRSAFGGRNFEYYSECGVLSGLTAAAEVSGATENGLICYVKHFAFNDQDNYRQNNICTWLNEQSAREIYLKAFEQPIKAGGMGVMTSMNAVGPVWAGGCKALLTNILRDEWGFHGAVITDAVVSAWYMDGNLAIRTGGTKMLAFNITNEFYRDLNSVGTVTAMRNAAHGTLYALANSFAVTRAVSVPKWVKTTYAVDAVVAIILVAWEICAIRKYRKAKKEDEDTEQ